MNDLTGDINRPAVDAYCNYMSCIQEIRLIDSEQKNLLKHSEDDLLILRKSLVSEERVYAKELIQKQIRVYMERVGYISSHLNGHDQ
jgi:hypothetical protein